MTAEEAIKVIEKMATTLNISPFSKEGEALMEAIYALKIQKDYAEKNIWKK